MLFSTNGNNSMCNVHLLDVFLTEELSCGTILIIKGHPQGQNINV